MRLHVDNLVLHRLSPRVQACVSLDWWPDDKCDYDDCPWANSSLLTLDFADPLVVSAMRALSPVALRVGGSLADQVVYATPESGGDATPGCEPFVRDPGRRLGFRGGCLPWSRWTRLFAFCEQVDCQVYFSVNALHGRVRAACPPGTRCRELPRAERPACCTNYTGGWDGANLHALLRASAAAGLRPTGLAYGNELAGAHSIEARLPAAQYADEVLRLGAMARSVWPLSPPLLLAPDSTWDEAWFGDFVGNLSWPQRPEADDGASPPSSSAAAASSSTSSSSAAASASASAARRPVDVLTHHMYPLGAGDLAEMHAKVLSPKHLDGTNDRLKQAARLVRNRTGGVAEVGVSETGGAYNSGQRGTTDAFASTFWCAKHGQKAERPSS